MPWNARSEGEGRRGSDAFVATSVIVIEWRNASETRRWETRAALIKTVIVSPPRLDSL